MRIIYVEPHLRVMGRMLKGKAHFKQYWHELRKLRYWGFQRFAHQPGERKCLVLISSRDSPALA